MRRLIYLATARRDLADILRCITKRSENLVVGRRFVDELRGQCRQMASLPVLLGRPRPELREDIRTFTFLNYVIVFRYRDNTIEVVNVLEGHRDLGAFFRDGEN